MMRLSIALLVCVILTVSAFADKSASDDPLDLIHADRLQSTGKDVNNITTLSGNVHLSHGDTELWSQRAVWYKKTSVVVFLDSVRLIDGSRTMTTQHLTYYRNSGSATAIGVVEIDDKLEQVNLKASKVDYIKDEDRFIATGGPLLTLMTADDSSKTVIVGDSILYNTETKTGRAINDVEITRRDIEATSQTADFEESGEKIILRGDPKVYQSGNLLEGDEIELRTKARSLVGMLIEGHARATYRSRPDTLKDDYTEAVLEGKQLEVFFVSDEIDKAVMRRNATSFYTPAESDTVAKGKNVASGDSITLFFDKTDIFRVLILGGAQGHYTEERYQPDEEALTDTTYYDAEEIDYLVKDRLINLTDRGVLSYENMALESGWIQYDLDEEILIAEGVPVETDSGEVFDQTPILKEDADELFGQRMVYNIKSRKGKVELGKTEMDQGYYRGKRIRQVEDDVLFVTGGEYTTCDREHTHFHFYCHHMKMLGKEKVIARPVILMIGPLPIFAIPYYVFPTRKGRHSGILPFQLGNFERGERFIRNVGYYWAASDYWDAQASFDYYENKSTVLNGRVNYNLRYKLNGNVSTSFSRNTSWSNYERQVRDGWSVRFSHSQTLSESMRLSGSGRFLSSKDYNQDNSYDQEERLNRSVNAQANFRKNWQNESISIAVDQNWNLDTDIKTRRLPTIQFSRKSLPLFSPPSKKKKNERVLPWIEEEEEETDSWYHSIYFGINSTFNNYEQLNKKNEILDWTKYKTLKSKASLRSPQKFFGFLTISPTANIEQTFYKIDKTHTVDSVDIVTDDYFRREVWSAGISMNTSLYGTVYPNIFRVTGLRHVITPSVSYSYAPKVEKNQEYQQFTGVGSSSSRRKNMTFSLNNVFQMKAFSGGEEKKIDLFSLNSSTGYDFEKDDHRLSDLSSSLRSGALKILNISLSSRHSFYDEITQERQLLNPRLLSFSASTSFSRKFRLGGKKKTENEGGFDFGDDFTQSPIPGKGDPTFGENKETSLNVSLSHRYVEQRSGGHVKSKTSKLSAAFDLSLTKGWQMNLDFQYDLEKKQTEFPVLKMGRNLHCWAGEFIWQPSGPLAGYYFRIYIKQIPDIKVEQSLGGVRGR
ncbi:MAG: hypothetical protein GY839_08035 [candidate division Zixibacteria bacterium]|nr:hypothetical protein [candidate division Zixibacteria bacterium]